MIVWGVVVVLVAALGASLLWLVLRRARRLSEISQRLLADALEPRSTFPSVVLVRGVHIRTVLDEGGADPLLPGLVAGAPCTVEVSDREVVVGETSIALHRIADGALVGAFEDVRTGEGDGLFRLRWRRGGLNLSTVVRFARRLDAEKVRRELHLRLGAPAVPPGRA